MTPMLPFPTFKGPSLAECPTFRHPAGHTLDIFAPSEAGHSTDGSERSEAATEYEGSENDLQSPRDGAEVAVEESADSIGEWD